jgi:hypothetical protein
VKRRAGKTIGAVSQEFLVMTVEDERQRQLEIVTQWQGNHSACYLSYIFMTDNNIAFTDTICRAVQQATSAHALREHNCIE